MAENYFLKIIADNFPQDKFIDSRKSVNIKQKKLKENTLKHIIYALKIKNKEKISCNSPRRTDSIYGNSIKMTENFMWCMLYI